LQQFDQYKEQARVLKALANETRLRIVHRLGSGQCSVGEMVRTLKVDQSTVSKHLAVLRNIGVVEDQRHGNKVVYRLLTPCVIKFFSCASQVLKARR
jgi:ArsR family transcriptional regulator